MIMPATYSPVRHNPLPQPLAHAYRPTARVRTPVYFFLDFSNIAISAGQIGPKCGNGLFDRGRVRIHSGNLRQFVERDRIWQSGFAAAGLSSPNSPLKRQFQECGIEFEVCERGCNTGTEQNVDERIRMEMLELMDSTTVRGTIALATGDGSGFQNKRGFIKTLSILKQQGFSIEVMSWRHSFNPHLREWAMENGRAIELDPFYEDLTFVKGGRVVTPSHQLSNKLVRCGIF